MEIVVVMELWVMRTRRRRRGRRAVARVVETAVAVTAKVRGEDEDGGTTDTLAQCTRLVYA